MDKAPIVLFVYNRIEHTQKTIEALQKNIFADFSDLYVFSDGPKNEEASLQVKEIRKFLSNVSGFRSVNIIERETNLGLAENIISGVTEIINKYNRVIVLEDDIVTSKYFLQFMNESLDKYEFYNEVMSISGYLSPINKTNLPDSFFLPWFECWGWATWKRSWDFFDRNPEKLLHRLTLKQINYINENKSFPQLWDQVINNYTNRMKTWAIFYHVVICENFGKVLYPKDSLCKNIGFDGSGENCAISNTFDVELKDGYHINFPELLEYNELAIDSLIDFNNSRLNNIIRMKLFIKRIIFYIFMHLIHFSI